MLICVNVGDFGLVDEVEHPTSRGQSYLSALSDGYRNIHGKILATEWLKKCKVFQVSQGQLKRINLVRSLHLYSFLKYIFIHLCVFLGFYYNIYVELLSLAQFTL